MTFTEHLKTYLNDEEIDSLMKSLNDESKHAVLLNPSKMNDEEFLSIYPHAVKHPIVNHAYIYDKNEYDLGKSVWHTLGCFYLQEPSAMIPAYLLSPNKGEVVLDLCAAPGGKSVQTSFLMENDGLIISNDLSKSRAFSILENVERLGIGNIIITNNDFSLINEKFNNFFDKIILDAPCSGSGMFRKEDKMRDDWSYNKVLKFSEIQKEMILYAYNMLKEGGTMVYSTCSFSFEEDEEVIKYLLDHSDAEMMNIEDNDHYYVFKKLPLGVHLFPSRFPGEGHYIALIKKPGVSHPHKKENKNLNPKYKEIYIDSRLHHFEDYGGVVFSLPMYIKLPNCLNIIRKGVKIFEWNNGNYRYDYHYSHCLNSFPNIARLDEDNLYKYMRGEQIRCACTRGYILLIFKNVPLSFGKSDGKVIKNHFPKGLRR
ncbi:MAG: NOL1/NOP2/sun family putative RNA methylase [Bacilli bacterium]|nr:NOL1/NOP2/sun family putative RNA methylase [Bacilli bacterium]